MNYNLTDNQKMVAIFLVNDYTPEMIAEELNTPRNNVYQYMNGIRAKMGTNTMIGALIYAISIGIIPMPSETLIDDIIKIG